MTEMMDISGSLRKIARELTEIDVFSPGEVATHLDATSFLLLWIADGLDKELALAAERGKWMQEFRKLNPGDHGESTVT